MGRLLMCLTHTRVFTSIINDYIGPSDQRRQCESFSHSYHLYAMLARSRRRGSADAARRPKHLNYIRLHDTHVGKTARKTHTTLSQCLRHAHARVAITPELRNNISHSAPGDRTPDWPPRRYLCVCIYALIKIAHTNSLWPTRRPRRRTFNFRRPALGRLWTSAVSTASWWPHRHKHTRTTRRLAIYDAQTLTT